VLLDTHVWLWAVEDAAGRLGRQTRRLLSKTEARSTLRISVVSVFEVIALHAAGRLRLARTPEQWMREALDSPALRLAELTSSIAIDAGGIARASLPDPMDRLLVATARQLDVPLVTADRAILDHAARARSPRVHDASL
jgi:PIN domain nuclease of toxin-antitoxin system